jgi:hypothetical protein
MSIAFVHCSCLTQEIAVVKRLRNVVWASVIGLTVVFVACNKPAEPQTPDQAIQKFRDRYDKQLFDEIYSESSRAYQLRLSRDRHREVMQQMWMHYGRFKSSLEQNRDTSSDGKIATFHLISYFEKGTATEYIGFGYGSFGGLQVMRLGMYETEPYPKSN